MATVRQPPLESLRIFEACARHLNFTHAAAELGLTQAAVSLRIRNLEADIGAKLFVRSRPRPVLSSAGATLTGELNGALQTVAGAVARARAPSGLRVTATPTFARWLAPRLPRFSVLSRGCAVELEVSTELRKLGPDAFDLAVRSGHGCWKGAIAEPLGKIECTPMLHPRLCKRLGAGESSAAALLRLTLLADERWTGWFRLAGVEQARTRLSRTKFASEDMVAEAALAAAGAALLSPWLFGDLLRTGRLVAPFAETLEGPDGYFLVAAPHGESASRAAFAAWLKKEVRRAHNPRRNV